MSQWASFLDSVSWRKPCIRHITLENRTSLTSILGLFTAKLLNGRAMQVVKASICHLAVIRSSDLCSFVIQTTPAHSTRVRLVVAQADDDVIRNSESVARTGGRA